MLLNSVKLYGTVVQKFTFTKKISMTIHPILVFTIFCSYHHSLIHSTLRCLGIGFVVQGHGFIIVHYCLVLCFPYITQLSDTI